MGSRSAHSTTARRSGRTGSSSVFMIFHCEEKSTLTDVGLLAPAPRIFNEGLADE